MAIGVGLARPPTATSGLCAANYTTKPLLIARASPAQNRPSALCRDFQILKIRSDLIFNIPNPSPPEVIIQVRPDFSLLQSRQSICCRLPLSFHLSPYIAYYTKFHGAWAHFTTSQWPPLSGPTRRISLASTSERIETLTVSRVTPTALARRS